MQIQEAEGTQRQAVSSGLQQPPEGNPPSSHMPLRGKHGINGNSRYQQI
ncbi:20164_t:CDS:2 [Racocetra persica]|uniref:20164_t:CDS:1 n=1 Tax=Racocetra persica TaxID=160502 RepID=A0ACA9M559_9GLOM|nr:20164_t:CDS:2 [Racocetra persica]